MLRKGLSLALSFTGLSFASLVPYLVEQVEAVIGPLSPMSSARRAVYATAAVSSAPHCW